MLGSSIHHVTKIVLGEIHKLSGKTVTRKVRIFAKVGNDGDELEVIEITCFADDKESLGVEVAKTERF